MSQSQQQSQATYIQEEKIRISIIYSTLKALVKNYDVYSRSHEIRFTFYNESNLCKRICKSKDQVDIEDKNNIVYETDCNNCEAVYFRESKGSLISRSDEHIRSHKSCDCEKNEIVKHCWEVDYNFRWDQKVVDRKSRLIPIKIKETIHSLKNPI